MKIYSSTIHKGSEFRAKEIMAITLHHICVSTLVINKSLIFSQVHRSDPISLISGAYRHIFWLKSSNSDV